MIKLNVQKRLSAYGLFLTLGAFFVCFLVMVSPSESKNVVFGGYSLERILLGVFLLFVGFALLTLTWSLFHRPVLSGRLWSRYTQQGQAGNAVFFFSLFFFALGWFVFFIPSYRLGALAGYIERLYPVFVWLAIVGAVTSIILLFERRGVTVFSRNGDRSILKIAVVVVGMFGILALFIYGTGFGIRHPADYWYGAGVPVLWGQMFLSLIVGALALLLDNKFKVFSSKRFDVYVFIAIWIVSAWFWAHESLTTNYFLSATDKNPVYPYSDSALFDAGAQFALIGQGVFGGAFFERVLYSIFLVYLHLLAGQDIIKLLAAQAAIFAAFPAVVYLIGRELHSRALGLSAGMLAAFRGVNAIVAAKWIDTASPKMILTDFPTAIGVAVFILLFIKWYKTPSGIGSLIWAGAILALTSMLRLNTLVILPVFLVAALFLIKLPWRQVVLAGLLVLIGMLTVTLPWELRNQSRGFPMYSMYYTRIVFVLRSRYGIGMELPPPSLSQVTAMRNVDGFSRQRIVSVQADTLPCVSLPCTIMNHFMRNTLTSFASLPTSLTLNDLRNTIKSDTPYWNQDWNTGAVDVAGLGLMLVNLVVVSLGVGSVWGKIGKRVWLPILSFWSYLFGNSIALTSGGRYITPIDWIVYLFFIAGGLQLVVWFLRAAGFNIDAEKAEQTESARLPSINRNLFSKKLPTLLSILLLGILLPLSEIFFQPRYQIRQPSEILAQLEESGLLAQTGYSRSDLEEFLLLPNAVIREGRALYPRYYSAGEGEPDKSTHFRPLEYNRLAFSLIGPYSPMQEGVVLPTILRPSSLHTADVVVLGCLNLDYYQIPFIDAVVVFSTMDRESINRMPPSPLQCPLQIP